MPHSRSSSRLDSDPPEPYQVPTPEFQPRACHDFDFYNNLAPAPPHPRQSHPAGEMSYERCAPRDERVPDNAPFSATQQDRGGNVPERYESILLTEDEAKVTETPETRVPNASLFTLAKEDHTLGNLLRDRLLRDPACATEFAAYQVPHPLFPDVLVRVQTDGSVTPREAVIRAARGLIGELEGVKGEFQKEWEIVKIRRVTEEGLRNESGGAEGTGAMNGANGAENGMGGGYGMSGGYGGANGIDGYGGGQPNGNYGYQGYGGQQGQSNGYSYGAGGGGYGAGQNGGY